VRGFQLVFLVFLLVPLIEIYLLVQVGGLIGAAWTVFLVVLTAVIGASLVRRQGLSTLARLRTAMDRGELPALEMLEGAAILLAGALLLTPGFFTDAVGFACLLPPLRRQLLRRALARGLISTRGKPRGPSPGPQGGSPAARRRRTLEGEYKRED
jgi:UPF0716 protein FxsA